MQPDMWIVGSTLDLILASLHPNAVKFNSDHSPDDDKTSLTAFTHAYAAHALESSVKYLTYPGQKAKEIRNYANTLY